MAGSGCAPANAKRRGFQIFVPARLIKDPAISPQAKLLCVILGVYADGKTGRTYVGLRTVERLTGCGRDARQRAQRPWYLRCADVGLDSSPCSA